MNGRGGAQCFFLNMFGPFGVFSKGPAFERIKNIAIWLSYLSPKMASFWHFWENGQCYRNY